MSLPMHACPYCGAPCPCWGDGDPVLLGTFYESLIGCQHWEVCMPLPTQPSGEEVTP